MLSLLPVAPKKLSAEIVERFFITKGNLPPDFVWEHTALPSIMQSVIINAADEGEHTVVRTAIHDQNVVLTNDLILGQFTKRFSTSLEGSVHFIGIHFTPTGLYRLLQKPAQLFADTILQLQDHIQGHSQMRERFDGAATQDEQLEILEDFIVMQMKPNDAPNLQQVAHAAERIRASNGTEPLPEVGRHSGLSERTMQRYFLEYIGVSPKAFARIARFNAVTKMMEENSTNDLQVILSEAGYFDAAHFTHDFKAITGQTPSAYYKGKSGYEKFFYGT